MSNPVALITGCSSGIGRELVIELAKRGCTVYASARKPETLEDLKAANVHTIALDVCDNATMDAAVERIEREQGRIDILVNNGGFGQMGPLIDLTEEQFRRQMDTNVIGQFLLIQRVVPGMIKRRSGCIANVGSVSGIMATPFAGAYCGSKAALNVMSDSLRMELAPFGIDVIIVAPGAVKSKFGDNAESQVGIADNSAYAPIRDGVLRRAQMSQIGATPGDQVAREIADALLATPRPTWVATGAGSKKYPLMKRFIPTRKLDAKMSGLFGLEKLRKA
jgi:NAD(P)-dependent dehydrogenase (short-subunit alcohol dehydrogenase family)